jgi:hypothetical protein
VIGALRVRAEACAWLCGKRPAPFLIELVPALEAEGALHLEPSVRSQLLTMSAALLAQSLDNADRVAHMPTPNDDDGVARRFSRHRAQTKYRARAKVGPSSTGTSPPSNLCSEATIQRSGSTKF